MLLCFPVFLGSLFPFPHVPPYVPNLPYSSEHSCITDHCVYTDTYVEVLSGRVVMLQTCDQYYTLLSVFYFSDSAIPPNPL